MHASLLLVLLISQTPTTEDAPATAPPPEETAPPATSDAPPPTERARRVRDAVRQATQPPAEQPQPPKPATTPLSRFERLTDSGPGHYLFYYAPDYLSVAVMGGLSAAAFVFPPPVATRSAFGPSYDPATRDTTDVYAHQYDRLLGGQFRHDTVPSWMPALVGNAALLGAGAITLVRDRTFRKVHHLVLGAVQAQLATTLTTELMKSSFARLRPDFRERMELYYCAPGREVPQGVDCVGARERAPSGNTAGYWLDERELDNGRRSFPSGHATSAFSVATYFALFVGGEYVWGENASAATRIPGVAAQAAALTAAAFVAGSRLTDNRHHPEDVLVGAGLGAGMAAIFYFLHFDLRGRPFIRKVSFAPTAGNGGMGITLRGLF